MRVRPSPAKRILEYLERNPGATRSDVASALGISYWSARYWLERLAESKLIRKEVVYIGRNIRRIFYYPVRWELVSTVIVIYSVTESPKEYTKRFQGFYDVDAMRDRLSGEINFEDELTRKEIEACIDDFMARFGWAEVPPHTTRPRVAETSEYEVIDKPRGAILKSLSVIEDEEETYFETFYETVYFPEEGV